MKSASIDMYEPYMSLVKEPFPNANIIIDCFHIIQSINCALNIARVSVTNMFRNMNRPLYNKFKTFWRLILKPYEQLNGFKYKNTRLFKEWKTTKGIVDYLLDIDNDLFNTHHRANALRHAVKHNDSESFMEILYSI